MCKVVLHGGDGIMNKIVRLNGYFRWEVLVSFCFD